VQERHGPHSIVLSPDWGVSIRYCWKSYDFPEMDTIVCPMFAGDKPLSQGQRDPSGHANDRGAPGGWIAKIDPEGKHWKW